MSQSETKSSGRKLFESLKRVKGSKSTDASEKESSVGGLSMETGQKLFYY
jgi:hypothetical protein